MGQTSELQKASALRETVSAALPRVVPPSVLDKALELARGSESADLGSAHGELSRALREWRHSQPVADEGDQPNKPGERRVLTLHILGQSHSEIGRLLDLPRRQVQTRIDAGDLDPLRRSLAGTGARVDCPRSGTIWQASTCDRPSIDVVDHISSCPACAESWRLAVAIRRETSGAADVIQLFRTPPKRSEDPGAESPEPRRRQLPKFQLPRIDWPRAAVTILVAAIIVGGLVAAVILPTY